MACTDSAAYLDYGAAQVRNAPLQHADIVNADRSLIAIDPYVSAAVRASYKAILNPDLAYFFLGSDGCPILTVPPTSPSFQAWVTGSAGVPPAPPPPAPPPPAPTDTFYAAGDAAIKAANLSTADSTNAYYSLRAQDPFLSAVERAANLALVKPGLAYFSLTASGAPSLVIPSVAPPPSGPCPPGFVSQQPGVTPSYTLQEMINHQLLQIPVSEVTATGACKPLPTVTTVGQWLTATDCLAVTVVKTQATTGLTLEARILDCDGLLHYMSYGLDAVPVNVRTTLTLPITPGYLLDAAVSNVGSGLTAGAVFASISIQHTCAAGVPPASMLAAGYVTDLYAVSWPAMPGGSPYAPPTALPGPAVPTILQYKAALVADDAAGVTVTLDKTVSAGGSALVAWLSAYQTDTALTDTQLNSGWTRIAGAAHRDMWICPNAKAGVTTITAKYSAVNHVPLMLHVAELARVALTSPVDVSAQNADGGPITATTGSTSVADIGFAGVLGLATVTAGVTPPAGWIQVLDTIDSGGNRLVSLVNLNLSTPPATWAFTSTMKAADTYLTLAALKVATA
jgi:hypothetical protein